MFKHFGLILFIISIVKGHIVGLERKPFTYKTFHDMDSKPPIYVEKIENIHVYTETWTIVTRVELTYYQQELNHLQDLVNNTSHICEELPNFIDNEEVYKFHIMTHGCRSTIKELKIIMKEIEEKNLNQFTVETAKRVKRGLFNIFGYTSKALIGTLTEKDGERYEQQFDEVKQRGELSQRILEKHTSLLEASAEMFKCNTEELEKQRVDLQNQIDQIRYVMEALRTAFDKNALKLKFLAQDAIAFTALLIIDFKGKQEEFIQALAIGTGGVKHQILLPPRTLISQLEKINDEINTSQLRLPFDIHHQSLAKFYDISVAASRVVNQQLIVTYTFPLLSTDEFQLYQLYAYPRKMENNLFQMMLPDLPYVVMDKLKENYIPMTEKELDKCYNNGENTLLCPLSRPIISTKNSDSCSISLLTQPTLPCDCNFRISNITIEIWFKLRESNSWLYVLPKEQEITIDCNGDIDKPGCVMKTEYVKIIENRERNSEVHRKVEVIAEMTMNWKDIMKTIHENKESKFENSNLPRIIDGKQTDILQKFSIGLNDIKQLETNRNLGHKIRREMNIASIISDIAIIIVTIYM